jgi:hypothetical protein
MDTVQPNNIDPGALPQRAGYLLAPFGWAAEPLLALAHAEPVLLSHLFELSRPRMHAIALALAHIDGSVSRQFAPFLACASSHQIIIQALGRSPTGITRVLQRLPTSVLEPENYRQLVTLLNEPKTAKLLHHVEAIDDYAIRLLCDIPVELVQIAQFVLDRRIGRLDGFTDGLRFLVSRGASPSFEALIADLTIVNHPNQLIAKMKDLVDDLPLPKMLPPTLVGKARRLDRPAEIRALAKRWQNCLAHYVHFIDSGGNALYLWQDRQAAAACLVERCGRLGWFLDQVKGPRNADLKPSQLEAVHKAFADAGIPSSSILHPIQTLLLTEPGSVTRRRPRV